MKKTVYILFAFIWLFICSCKKEVTTADYIKDVLVTPSSIQADGSTIIFIKAILNSDLDNRAIQFDTEKGVFQNSDMPNTITINAEKVNDTLIAVARLKAPATVGAFTISVQPGIVDLEGKFVVVRTITATNSEPASIDLTANAFSVHNNFNSEIELTGLLKNSDGNGVSRGVKVEIEDFDLNYSALPGVFRNSSLSTRDDSRVSTLFTPGQIASDQFIYLISTILKEDGTKSNIADTIKIFVTKKD